MFFCLIIFLFLLSSLEFIVLKRQIKYLIMVLMVIIISIIEGLRYETGTDWIPYYEFFYTPTIFETGLFEIGYVYFQILVKKFTENYIVFLFLLTSLKNFIIYSSLYKLSNKSLIVIPIFFSGTIGYIGANRQWIAVAFVMLSYININNWHKWIYLFLGFLFHRSVLLIVPLLILDKYILKKIKVKNFFIKFFIIFTFIIFLKNTLLNIYINLALIIFENFWKNSIIIDKFKYYLLPFQIEYLNMILGILKNSIILIIYFIINKKNKVIYQKYDSFILFGFIFGLLNYTLFYGKMQVLVARGGIYFFSIFTPLILNLIIKELNSYKKLIGYFIIILYSVFTFYRGISIYPELFIPYKSIFYNKEYKREHF